MADVTATAFLNFAREYHEAAGILLAEHETRLKTGSGRPLTSAVSQQYHHTVESALKAFLRAHGLPIEGTSRKTHLLTALYEECRSLGLVVDPDDRIGIANIVSLLESGNEGQGFRYFNHRTVAAPDLGWTRDVVNRFMTTVEREVEARDPEAHAPQRLSKVIFTVGRPTPSVPEQKPPSGGA